MATTIGMDAPGSKPASIIPNNQVVSAKPKDPSGAGLGSFMGFLRFLAIRSGHSLSGRGGDGLVFGVPMANRGSDAPVAEMQRDDLHAGRLLKTGRRSDQCQARRLARSWKIEPMKSRLVRAASREVMPEGS